MTRGLRVRIILIAVLIVGARLLVAGREPTPKPLREPLARLPLTAGAWHAVEGPPLDAETLRILGADDYVNRVYVTPEGAAAALYVAFYEAQRQGDSIHSPKNCLPGNGWVPVASGRDTFTAAGQRVDVNRYVVERHGARQLVVYWFQGRGRSVASEYTNKAYLLLDAWRLGRTDGALIRVTTPMAGRGPGADAVVRELVNAVAPQLNTWLPS